MSPLRSPTTKKANNLPIFQPARERAKLQDVAEKAGPEMANYTRVLYSHAVRAEPQLPVQAQRGMQPLYRNITQAIEHTPKLFSRRRPWSPVRAWRALTPQIACEKNLQNPFIMYLQVL